MEKIKIHVQTKKILADLYTPIGIYLRLRDAFANTILLESSDYHTVEDSYSFIAAKPLSEIVINQENVRMELPDGRILKSKISPQKTAVDVLNAFYNLFEPDKSFPFNGIYGYTAFDAIKYFDSVELKNSAKEGYQVPEIRYVFYQFVIAVNHFSNELILLENQLNGHSELNYLLDLLHNKNVQTFSFDLLGSKISNFRDTEFLKAVEDGKANSVQGDLIQLVLSRQYAQKFRGDDFNLYRSLRAVNPSPYLFYFDYGSYKIFGSSPETQLVVSENIAYINPIAGTYRRSGDDETDRILARKLKNDPKELAEHKMLVDLARNDLSRNGTNIQIERNCEVQFYSHVLHLVSSVSAELLPDTNIFQVFADTFPAGTLSGAPKYRALELIDRYENQARGIYGGAIGLFGFDKSVNHAIVIRSFLSKNNVLYSQAGAGIVAESVPEKEVQEVNNKLEALSKALQQAERI